MKETGYPSIDRLHEKGVGFFKKNPVIPGVSITDALKLMNLTNHDGYAIDCNDIRITFKELIKHINTVSKAFLELGIKENDIVVTSTSNITQTLATFFAANQIGVCVSFLGAGVTNGDIIHYLNEFESKLLITDRYNEELFDYVSKRTKTDNIIYIDDLDIRKKTDPKERGMVGYRTDILYSELEGISKYYKHGIKRVSKGNKDAQIVFTSGSTGKPKSIVLTNENIMASAMYMKSSTNVPINKGEKCLVTVSFKVPYGLDTSAIMTLLCGKEAILANDLSLSNIHKYLAKKPNYIFGCESFYNLMMNSPMVKDMDLSGIEVAICGGSYLSVNRNAELTKFFRDRNSEAHIYNGLGTSETAGAYTNAVGFEVKPETVGKLLVGTNMMILDPKTNEEVKYGEEGIICVSGKHVFSRYYNDKDATDAVIFTDKKGVRWYRSDLLGKIRKDGYVEVAGRGSDSFITLDETGDVFKVYCNRVREVLKSIPYIQEAFVMEKEDLERSKVPLAFIEFKKEYKDDLEIFEKLNSDMRKPVLMRGTNELVELKNAEIPQEIILVSEIPFLESGKVDRKSLEKKLVKKRN